MKSEPIERDPDTGFPKQPLLVYTRKYGWIVAIPNPHNAVYLHLRPGGKVIRVEDVLECYDLPPPPLGAR